MPWQAGIGFCLGELDLGRRYGRIGLVDFDACVQSGDDALACNAGHVFQLLDDFRYDFLFFQGILQVEIALSDRADQRSEEHTSELQSLMRISYAVFCLKKKKKNT